MQKQCLFYTKIVPQVSNVIRANRQNQPTGTCTVDLLLSIRGVFRTFLEFVKPELSLVVWTDDCLP